MNNLINTFGIIALAAIIGFSMIACGGGGGSGGGGDGIGDLSLRYNDVFNSYYVSFSVTPGVSGLSGEEYILTIDGTTVSIGTIETESTDNSRIVRIHFSGVTITPGVSYSVRLEYNGSLIPSFVKEQTVTAQ